MLWATTWSCLAQLFGQYTAPQHFEEIGKATQGGRPVKKLEGVYWPPQKGAGVTKHLYVGVGPGGWGKKIWRGGSRPLQLGEAGQGLPLPHPIFTKKTKKFRGSFHRQRGWGTGGNLPPLQSCRSTHTLLVKNSSQDTEISLVSHTASTAGFAFLFEKEEMKSSINLVNPTLTCWQPPSRVWLPWQCLPGDPNRGFRLCLGCDNPLGNPCSSKGLLAADCSVHQQGSEPQTVSDTDDIFCENHSSGSWVGNPLSTHC